VHLVTHPGLFIFLQSSDQAYTPSVSKCHRVGAAVPFVILGLLFAETPEWVEWNADQISEYVIYV